MIPEDWLAAAGNHLWQTTVFAAVAAGLTMALRGNAARVRHWVWLAASLKFLVPFSILMALGSHFHPRTVLPMPAPGLDSSGGTSDAAVRTVGAGSIGQRGEERDRGAHGAAGGLDDRLGCGGRYLGAAVVAGAHRR